MQDLTPFAVEMRDVVDGLWLWRQPHPDWQPGGDWEPQVSSFVVGSTLLDPLAPPPSAREVWDRIEAARPETAVTTFRFLIWRDSMRLVIASCTIWRSMISPSTIASLSGSEMP